MLCVAFEFFGGFLPKNNRFIKRINRIRSRVLRNMVKALLFLLAVCLICSMCF